MKLEPCKGGTIEGMFRPFRARAFWLTSPYPGRCRGLVCCGPFGAKSQTAQHQNLRVGLV